LNAQRTAILARILTPALIANWDISSSKVPAEHAQRTVSAARMKPTVRNVKKATL